MTTLTAPPSTNEREVRRFPAGLSVAASTIDTVPLQPGDHRAWNTYAAIRHALGDGDPLEDTADASDPVGTGNTFFHTTAWMASVGDTFGHRPRYLRAQRDGRIVDILPMFEIRSLLAGRL